MQLIADLLDPAAPVTADTPGEVLYARFNDEPDTLSVAVVDETGRPLGLVERGAFFLKMASQYGRALYAARPIALVMDDAPIVVEASTSVAEFMGQALSSRASALLKGFIGVDQGRYAGVGSALSVLQAVNSESQARARRMTELAERLAMAEAQALAREASFRLLFEANPMPMCLWDRDSLRMLAANDAALNQYGYSRDQLPNLNITDLIAEDEAPRLASLRAGVHQERDGETWKHRRADGSVIEVLPLIRSLTYEGRPVGLAALFDMTERKRDAELLAHARDAAEAANRAKSEFLANISHEIRTPLNGVLGIAGVLAKTGLSPEQREMVAIIESSSVALDRLLSDILDIARVESGRLSITSEPFALGELVREAAAVFAAPAREKGLRFECHVAEEMEVVALGDAFRVKQVLVNLISNAVKFTRQGHVAVRCFAAGDGAAHFEVEDSGVGFDPSRKDSLFGRFEQADGSITRQFGGSGLGLAISRDLTELMGGSLEADSIPGAGSTFRFRLPLKLHEAPASAEPTGASVVAHAGALRVLLADDHLTNRRVVELILGSAGAELTSVENGAEAVEAFRREAFDLVLMDMQMPVMDGLTAVREIRRLEQARCAGRTPIIMLTANTMPAQVRAAIDAGADRHVPKPISATGLLEAVTGATLPGAEAAEAA